MMCLLVLTMQAQQECVVFPFQADMGVKSEDIDEISFAFWSDFNPAGYAKQKPEEVKKTIDEMGYHLQDMSSRQMLNVGRKLDASEIVVGRLSKTKDRYRVDLRVIDVVMGLGSASDVITFKPDEYLTAMETVARRLARKMPSSLGETSSNSEASQKVMEDYIDLGLPSGTLWKIKNETGYYTYDKAMSLFGNLPTLEQILELKSECQWTINGSGYKVTGPNGNSIVLSAGGRGPNAGSVSLWLFLVFDTQWFRKRLVPLLRLQQYSCLQRFEEWQRLRPSHPKPIIEIFSVRIQIY